jgi:hypothetical protein
LTLIQLQTRPDHMLISKDTKLRVLEFVLGPLAALCLRFGLKLQDLIEAAKGALVHSAAERLASEGTLARTTALSLMTGVHRKDVDRIRRDAPPPQSTNNLLMKIMGLWQDHPDFRTKAGLPRVLSDSDDNDEFGALVRTISKEINPRSVLRELERISAVERTPRGLKLIDESFVPQGDWESGWKIAESDMTDFLRCVEQNVFEQHYPKHLHARTSYDNIDPAQLTEIRKWLLQEGLLFHQRVREYLSKFDRDANPYAQFEGPGARVSVSAFSLVEEAPEKDTSHE